VSLRAERVGGQFIQPLFVTHAGDGSGRVFVVEKIGRIRLLDGAGFLDIAPKVLAPPLFSYEREQGLLGLAFHPRFRENGYLYVHYNNRQGNHVFARFTARGGGPADSASEKVILTVDQPQTNFNGGMVVFGRDGYLYLGLGTGGTDRALQQGAQDLGNLLGKILRIDVDGGDPYRVPPDNPFVGRAGARGEVWAYGLRNPYRFSFDRLTGDLYVGTPGEFRREWINFSPAGTGAGQNYGWPILEGTLCWQAASCDRTGLPVPIAEYDTYSGGSCAVIGGYVYRGARYPALRGAYLYGDFCSSQIWLAARGASGAWSSTPMLRLGGLISSFGEDEAGELYVVEIHGGGVHRLAAAAR
jgi:glucose/arabinose dehydrogenase